MKKPSADRPPAAHPVLRHVRPSDLRALARLATQATTGVVDITEGVHQSVRRTLGLPEGAKGGRTSGLPGLIYRGIRGITQQVGQGLDVLLAQLLPLVDDPENQPEASPEREAVLAALNGVMGDRLRASGNPLALPMELRRHGRALPLDQPDKLRQALADATPRLLVLLHGLCMHDGQWQRDGHDHGAFLARELGYTPIYLRYNTGLHTSINAHDLAAQLEKLIAAWPMPLEDFTLLSHSMGGLVARGALHDAREAGYRWPDALRHLVFLGTPHHGAPLERAGHGVDLLLGSTPWSAPLARLGQLRSAGITDLRHGHVLDADWQGRSRFRSGADHRTPLPLPGDVSCHTVAATLAGKRGRLADRLTGDGLVPLRSALGEHDDPAYRLAFDDDHRHIAWRTGHLALLGSPDVARQLVHWLSRGTGPS